jgi:hypothetical protein
MVLTDIEREVLAWIAERTCSSALKDQLGHAFAVDREYTGAGSYTTLATPVTERATDAMPQDRPRGPIDGPWFQSPAMDGPACSLLWFTNGIVSCLELAGFREAADVQGFTFLPEHHA